MGNETRGWSLTDTCLTREGLALSLAFGVLASCGDALVSSRRQLESLTVVDGAVVRAGRPSSAAYAHYTEARLAMERRPPELVWAAAAIEEAIAYDPLDPGLWCLRAEIATRRGDDEGREASLREVDRLAPGWACPTEGDQSQLAR